MNCETKSSSHLRPRGFRAALLLAVVAFGGCQMFRAEAPPIGRSPLKPLVGARQEAELEVYFVRLPSADDKTAEELWRQVDEQKLPAETRRQLARNGFRAGVVGTQLPPQMTSVMSRASVPRNGQPLPIESPQEASATRHRMFLRPGQRGELITSGILSEFHVLELKEGQPQGQTLPDGQAEFAVAAEPLPDGRVRVGLTPEVHYGHFHQQFIGGDGAFRLNNSRKKKILDELALSATLSAGESLLIGGRQDRLGSLGERFFRETDGAAPRPRLLLLRLATDRSDPLQAAMATPASDVAEPTR